MFNTLVYPRIRIHPSAKDNTTIYYINSNYITTMRKMMIYSCALAMMMMTGSCGTVKTTSENPYGEEMTLTECEAYAQQMPWKRAAGKGTSYDESTARQQAELDARATFSRALEENILSASKKASFDITKYSGNDIEGNKSTDGGGQTNTLIKSISSNIISDTHIVKTNKFFGKNRQYTIFVCLEYSGNTKDMAEKVKDEVKQRISDNDRAKIKEELDRFEREFLKELTN